MTERKAPVHLYNAKDDGNWTNNSSWMDGRDPKQWFGVLEIIKPL